MQCLPITPATSFRCLWPVAPPANSRDHGRDRWNKYALSQEEGGPTNPDPGKTRTKMATLPLLWVGTVSSEELRKGQGGHCASDPLTWELCRRKLQIQMEGGHCPGSTRQAQEGAPGGEMALAGHEDARLWLDNPVNIHGRGG